LKTVVKRLCRLIASGYADSMIFRPDDFIALAGTHVVTALAAVSVLLLVTGAGWPQSAAPPRPSPPAVQTPAPQTEPPQAEPAPPREENPGLINELEKLWDKSKSMLPTLKSPQEAIDDLNARAKDATKDAGEGLSRLAKPSSMVTGRAACPVSANGAPDCKAGADKLCQSKGYKEGKSLDTDAAEKCSAKVYLPGHKREPGDCRTENYVTRALCQ
jgi:hypothetical protein